MGLSVSKLTSAWHEILIQKFSNMILYAGISLKAWRLCSITASSKDSVSFGKNHPLAAADLDGHGKTSCRNLFSSWDQKSNNMMLEKSHSIKTQAQECNPDGLCSLASNLLFHNLLLAESTIMPSPGPISKLDAGEVKLQKVSQSSQTQRSLSYCGGVVEELWWKVLDFAALKNSSVFFFNDHQQETPVAKWVRAKTRAAMVGRGLSKHDQAQKLALRYWLEAVSPQTLLYEVVPIDPHHRYGRNLHLYYDVWCICESSQPFLYWLEIGDGKGVNLDKCPRTKLQQQRIKYLGPNGREAYEVIVEGGKLMYRQSAELLETSGDSKWIFVLSTSRKLYVGRKRAGCFQHSSFLAGAATTFAGRLVAHGGVLEAVWPYSGHYLPTKENFNEFISFLEDNKVDITKVKRYAYDDQGPYQVVEDDEQPRGKTANIPTSKERELEESVLRLAKQLYSKWTTYNGSKVGSNLHYPSHLQCQTLKQANESPWYAPVPRLSMNNGLMTSPRSSPTVYGSPSVACLGVASPRALSASA